MACFLVPVYDQALCAVDEQVADRYPSAQAPPEREEADIFSQMSERTGITGYFDMQVGYDNNAYLDSNRYKDGFVQNMNNVEVTFEQTDSLDLKAGLDTFESFYFTYNTNNIVNIAPYVGFDYEIMPGLISRNAITYDYFYYPNYENSTFNGLKLSTYLRHYVTDNLYHEGGYEFIKRWYTDRKTYNNSGQKLGTDREDGRHRVKYKVGFQTKKFFIRLTNEFDKNDSNDDYQDYYDYWIYRLKPSVLYFFTDKLYTDVSFIYKYTDYKDRRASDDSSKKQRDNTYIIYASLYYDLTKSLTLSATYSYSENDSNSPIQKYSGSMFSGGISYSF